MNNNLITVHDNVLNTNIYLHSRTRYMTYIITQYICILMGIEIALLDMFEIYQKLEMLESHFYII